MFLKRSPGTRSLGFYSVITLLTPALAVAVACSAAPPDEEGSGDGDENGDGDGDLCLTDCDVGDGDGDDGINVGDGDGDGDTPTEMYCDEFDVKFEPQTPTVYVLVDASSSMSELGFWEPMKTGVLNVVQELTADVRFGLGTYTGTQTMCTGLNNVTPTLDTNNYQVIADAYNAIPAPPVSMDPSEKQETPTPLAVQSATELLLADESPGDRYILLVSDGEPDFCNDTTANCAVDGTVAAIQYARTLGVTTLVFAIDSEAIANPQYFDYFAQAGAGEQPNWPIGLNLQADGYSGQVDSECKSSPVAAEWSALREANGNAPDPAVCPPTGTGNQNCFLPAGDYSAAGGTTTAILNSDPAALAEQILASVSGLKSCVIELNFDVNPGSEDKGEIFVEDMETPIPRDQWRMNDTYIIELLGDACTYWQTPEVTTFFAGFPCEAVVVR